MRLTILLCVLAASVLSFTKLDNSSAIHEFQRWRMIGEKKVNFLVEKDVIQLRNRDDDFKKIMIKALDGPVSIKDLKIYFDNGGVQDVQVRKLIPKGGSTRVIDLTGTTRSLNRIEFWYETVGFANGKARVTVWGR